MFTDRYGVSWQVYRTVWERCCTKLKPKAPNGIMKAISGMKKLDLAELKAASSK
ncbi:MAG: hypothetical protein R3D26_24585 [Cyanobacteriota/Melainabacteria group bacterium]